MPSYYYYYSIVRLRTALTSSRRPFHTTGSAKGLQHYKQASGSPMGPCTELVSHQHEQVIPRSFHWHYSSQSLSKAGQGLLARLELQQELKFFFVLRCSSRWCS